MFKSIDTLLEPWLATARSGAPSPLKSATAADTGPGPVAKSCLGAKLTVLAPCAVVFNSIETRPESCSTIARSGLLSWLKSPTTTATGPAAVAKS